MTCVRPLADIKLIYLVESHFLSFFGGLINVNGSVGHHELRLKGNYISNS